MQHIHLREANHTNVLVGVSSSILRSNPAATCCLLLKPVPSNLRKKKEKREAALGLFDHLPKLLVVCLGAGPLLGSFPARGLGFKHGRALGQVPGEEDACRAHGRGKHGPRPSDDCRIMPCILSPRLRLRLRLRLRREAVPPVRVERKLKGGVQDQRWAVGGPVLRYPTSPPAVWVQRRPP